MAAPRPAAHLVVTLTMLRAPAGTTRYSLLATPLCGGMGGFDGDGCLRGGDVWFTARGAPARRSVGSARRPGATYNFSDNCFSGMYTNADSFVVDLTDAHVY